MTDPRFQDAMEHTVSERVRVALNQRQTAVEQERQKLEHFIQSQTFMRQEDRAFFTDLFNFYQHIESECIPPLLQASLPLTLDISNTDHGGSVVIFTWSLRNSQTQEFPAIAQVVIHHTPQPNDNGDALTDLDTLEDHLETALNGLCLTGNSFARRGCTPACRTVELLKDQLHEFRVISESTVKDHYDCLIVNQRFSVLVRLTPNNSDL